MFGVYEEFIEEHTSQYVTLNESVKDVRTIGNKSRVDLSYQISKIGLKDEPIFWDDVKFIFKAYSGSVLNPATNISPDDPGRYDDASDGVIEVEGWYIENQGSADTLDEGDMIKITGISSNYERAVLEITVQGDRICHATLPETLF